jgi:hypothetical protein
MACSGARSAPALDRGGGHKSAHGGRKVLLDRGGTPTPPVAALLLAMGTRVRRDILILNAKADELNVEAEDVLGYQVDL